MITTENKIYHVVGIMSGTSLDGIDLVLCRFESFMDKWRYAILRAETKAYPDEWINRLTNAPELSAFDFLQLHRQYGNYVGEQVARFLQDEPIQPDLVSSHGHTIFHQPGNGMTFQLGDGTAIATTCGITTVFDFRTLDVALGGQGAPLVPVGDDLLFSEYAYCLNLGGFSNISHRVQGTRLACDLSPVNIVLNTLAQRTGLPFDSFGNMGRSGHVNKKLVDRLDQLNFYQVTGPKSLGREWVETEFMPILDQTSLPLSELFGSVYEHISGQIKRYVNANGLGRILVTGGGAYNTFLLERIGDGLQAEMVVPDENLIRFKEALIFGFLGLLRFRSETNCLASVTGARRNSSSGLVILM